MATLLAAVRFSGAVLVVLGAPFLFLTYVISVVDSIHTRKALVFDGLREQPTQASHSYVPIASLEAQRLAGGSEEVDGFVASPTVPDVPHSWRSPLP